MERIERKNGYVYLVTGETHITRINLGKDPDDSMWAEDIKPKRKKKKKSGD